jgi:hypothetical protein
MAIQTLRIYSSGDGATADLIYDDVAMTCAGVHVRVPAGVLARSVNAVIGGQSEFTVFCDREAQHTNSDNIPNSIGN